VANWIIVLAAFWLTTKYSIGFQLILQKKICLVPCSVIGQTDRLTDITSLVKSCTREVNVAGTAKVSYQMGRGTKQTRGCNTSTVGIYILDNILDSLEAQTPCLVAVAASREIRGVGDKVIWHTSYARLCTRSSAAASLYKHTADMFHSVLWLLIFNVPASRHYTGLVLCRLLHLTKHYQLDYALSVF